MIIVVVNSKDKTRDRGENNFTPSIVLRIRITHVLQNCLYRIDNKFYLYPHREVQ